MPKEKAPEKETKLLSKKEEKRLRKLRVSVRSRFPPLSPPFRPQGLGLSRVPSRLID